MVGGVDGELAGAVCLPTGARLFASGAVAEPLSTGASFKGLWRDLHEVKANTGQPCVDTSLHL